jgi:phosphate transport system substrate-binding protein
MCAPVAAEKPIRTKGAGASFPAPLNLRWFRDYFLAHPHVQIDYQTTGNGAGINNFMGKRQDFAGSDLQFGPEEISQAEHGVIQIPFTAGVLNAYPYGVARKQRGALC